jgi:hypothetical protein
MLTQRLDMPPREFESLSPSSWEVAELPNGKSSDFNMTVLGQLGTSPLVGGRGLLRAWGTTGRYAQYQQLPSSDQAVFSVPDGLARYSTFVYPQDSLDSTVEGLTGQMSQFTILF